MKQMPFLLLILLNFAVVPAQNKTDNKSLKILGEWTFLYKENPQWQGDHFEFKKTAFKETAKIAFNSDGSIVLTRPNKQDQTFNWTPKEQIIKISRARKESKFLNGKFTAIFSENDQMMELREAQTPHGRIFFKR